MSDDVTPGRYLDGLQQAAARRLAPEVLRYVDQGSWSGVSAAEASAVWEAQRLVPRVLRDVTHARAATTLLGTEVAAPVAVAPTTLQRAAHPEGEEAMARGVAEAGSLLVVSSNAGTSFERIGATGAHWWLQMYVTDDRSASAPVIESALSAGASAVVLTADTPVVGTKHEGDRSVWDAVDPSWLRANFPPGTAEADKARDLGPHDVDWLVGAFGVPVVVKGVLHPDDARRCVEAGAAAVWVSNHGGRQLDGAVSTGAALPAVARAVGDSAEVYVDGGLRRGRHVVAALAMGARAAFLGRPPVHALAVDGSTGVRRLLDELAGEVLETLMLCGLAAPSAADGSLLWRL